ncbi:MAG: hypothetical protein OXC44_06140 [Proteobacteria bacterium]|nr:hypothetical protein [Pseudomonadota bacterium]
MKSPSSSSPNINLNSYLPLVWVLMCAVALACLRVLYLSDSSSEPLNESLKELIMSAMGYFVCNLAFLKLLDVGAFKKSFLRYDLVASRLPYYGTVYPWLELSVGISFLAFPEQLASGILATFMGVSGAISITINKLKPEQNTASGHAANHCACTGGHLKVPLGLLSIAENIAMIVMGIMLLGYLG